MIIDNIFLLGYIFFVGLFFGSFLNVLADRLPHGKTILGRSKCDKCNHVLSWRDLIPIISYAELRGKCRYCKASLSLGYPLSELMTAVIFALTWIFSQQWHSDTILSLIYLAIAAILIVMVLSDLRYQILPDEMQMSLLILGLVRFWYINAVMNSLPVLDLLQQFGLHILYGGVVMIPLFLVFLLSKGRGMGFGDVKFSFNIGFILGLWSGLGALYIGFITGGIVGALILLLKRGSLKSKIPFGPFLIVGFYLMLFFEHEVIYWIGKIYGFAL